MNSLCVTRIVVFWLYAIFFFPSYTYSQEGFHGGYFSDLDRFMKNVDNSFANEWKVDFSEDVFISITVVAPGALQVISETIEPNTNLAFDVPGIGVEYGNICYASTNFCRVYYLADEFLQEGSVEVGVRIAAQRNLSRSHSVELNFLEESPSKNYQAYFPLVAKTELRRLKEINRLKLAGDIELVENGVDDALKVLAVANAIYSVAKLDLGDSFYSVAGDATKNLLGLAIGFCDDCTYDGAIYDVLGSLGALTHGDPIPAYETIASSFISYGVYLSGLWDLRQEREAVTASIMAENLVGLQLENGSLINDYSDGELFSFAENLVLNDLLSIHDCSYLSRVFVGCGFTELYNREEFLNTYRAFRALLINKAKGYVLGNYYHDADGDGLDNSLDPTPNLYTQRPLAQISINADNGYYTNTVIPLTAEGSASVNGGELEYRWNILSAPDNAIFTTPPKSQFNYNFEADTAGFYRLALAVFEDGIPSKTVIRSVQLLPNPVDGHDLVLRKVENSGSNSSTIRENHQYCFDLSMENIGSYAENVSVELNVIHPDDTVAQNAVQKLGILESGLSNEYEQAICITTPGMLERGRYIFKFVVLGDSGDENWNTNIKSLIRWFGDDNQEKIESKAYRIYQERFWGARDEIEWRDYSIEASVCEELVKSSGNGRIVAVKLSYDWEGIGYDIYLTENNRDVCVIDSNGIVGEETFLDTDEMRLFLGGRVLIHRPTLSNLGPSLDIYVGFPVSFSNHTSHIVVLGERYRSASLGINERGNDTFRGPWKYSVSNNPVLRTTAIADAVNMDVEGSKSGWEYIEFTLSEGGVHNIAYLLSYGDGVPCNGSWCQERWLLYSDTILVDSDGDGVTDDIDAFINDISASVDVDGDQYPDQWNAGYSELDSTTNLKLDVDPSNPNIHEDFHSDADGIGDSQDDFPNDPAASIDSDHDGYPDQWNEGFSQADSTTGLQIDEFRYDPKEWKDSDGDTVGDNSDWAPYNSSESVDSDGDGVGDNSDWDNEDATEWADSDGDNVGDNADVAPNDTSRSTNVAPVLVVLEQIRVMAGDSITVIISATDSDADTVTLTIPEKPDFVTLEGNILSLEPTENHVGEQGFIVVASDNFGGEDTQEVSIIVESTTEPNAFPTIELSSPKEAVQLPLTQTELAITGTASDNDGYVSLVQYRLNNGNWSDVAGTDNWAFTLTNIPTAESSLEIRAKDDLGDWGDSVSVDIYREENIAGWRHPRKDLASTGSETTQYAPPAGQLTDACYDAQSGERVYALSGDVNGDGTLELVTFGAAEIHILNSKCELAFPIITTPVTGSSPFILEDIDRDGENEIIVGSSNTSAMQVTIYKADGSRISTMQPGSGGTDSRMWPIAYPGNNKLLVAYSSGLSNAYRGIAEWDIATETELWFYRLGPCVGNVSVGDADGDTDLDLIPEMLSCNTDGFGSGYDPDNDVPTDDSQLFSVLVDENADAIHTVLHGYGHGEYIISDLEGDGTVEIIATEGHFENVTEYGDDQAMLYDNPGFVGNGKLRILESNGIVRHEVGLGENIDPHILVSDIDLDGSGEVIVSCRADSSLRIYNNELSVVIVRTGLGGNDFYAYSAVDIDGDGEVEILTRDGSLLRIFNSSDLTELFSKDFGQRISNVFTTDLNGDDHVEIIVTTYDGLTHVVSDSMLRNPLVSAAANPLAINTFTAPSEEVLVFDFTLTSDNNGARISSITLDAEGDLNVISDIGSVKIYWDSNRNGGWDIADTLLNSGGYPEEDASLEIKFDPVPLLLGNTRFFVTYQLQ